MIKIDVVSECSLWGKKIKKNNTFFNSIIKFFPKKYKFIGKKINLTILLSNNKNIKKLNKEFRNKNKPTDVLSFPFEKKFRTELKKVLFFLIFLLQRVHSETTSILIIFLDQYKLLRS